MTYRFIRQHETAYDVQVMCRALGVSRSGYYAWRQRGETTQPEQRKTTLLRQIERVFAASQQTYGSPRVYAELKAQGVRCSRQQVARLMRQSGWSAVLPRRRVQTTRRDGRSQSSCNLLKREFTAAQPNRKWLVDITAIATDEGWLYLAGVLDLFSRRIVGWAMDEHMPDELTQAALDMAILQRQPPDALLHHSDQGSQYTSDDYQARLAKHRMLSSLSGVGCCYDNAPMESFWGTLKTELIYRQHYRTRAEAKTAIFVYIEGWYNRQRRHSALGYLSPEQFEQQFAS
jgi:Transposase and inactivated derivatives